MADIAKCPSCQDCPLTDTGTTLIDTAGVQVTVFACSTCDYTEGRPVEPPAPEV